MSISAGSLSTNTSNNPNATPGYPHDLYSTVNNTKAPTSNQQQQQQQQFQQIPIEIIQQPALKRQTKSQTQQLDIDLESNNHLIKQQHQKYIKNKFDTNIMRSKTPGPEMFRDRQCLIDNDESK